MNFRTIKHRYLIFTEVFTFTYAIVILPNLIPVLDQLPSPIATLLFLGVFAVSLWLLLYAVARENAFAQVTVVTLATMSGALGLNALYPTLNIPFYGSQGSTLLVETKLRTLRLAGLYCGFGPGQIRLSSCLGLTL